MNEEIVLTGKSLRERTAQKLKLLLAIRGLSVAALARRMGRPQQWLARRTSAEVAFDLDDLERIAAVLNLRVADLLPASEGSATKASLNDGSDGPIDRLIEIQPKSLTRPGSPQRPMARRPREIPRPTTAVGMASVAASIVR